MSTKANKKYRLKEIKLREFKVDSGESYHQQHHHNNIILYLLLPTKGTTNQEKNFQNE